MSSPGVAQEQPGVAKPSAQPHAQSQEILMSSSAPDVKGVFVSPLCFLFPFLLFIPLPSYITRKYKLQEQSSHNPQHNPLHNLSRGRFEKPAAQPPAQPQACSAQGIFR